MAKNLRHVWLALGLVALAGLGFGLTTLLTRLLGTPAQTHSAIGGPFTLVDDSGATVRSADFRGKWMLVYFGYTHCPDACPTALSHIDNTLDQIGPKLAGNVVPLFITVDPARDTPKVMHDYLSAFDVHIHGLSGSQTQIDAAEAGYRVYAAKHLESDGSYSMDHSSVIYVMNPAGDFVASFTDQSSVNEMAAKLRQLGA